MATTRSRPAYEAFAAAAVAVAFLVGCSPKAPGCADKETTSLMRELLIDDLGRTVNTDLAKGVERQNPSDIINYLTVNAEMRDWSPATLSKVGQETTRYIQGIKFGIAEIVSNGADEKARMNKCAGKITVTTLPGKEIVQNATYTTQLMLDQKSKFLLHLDDIESLRKPILTDLLAFLAAAKIGTDAALSAPSTPGAASTAELIQGGGGIAALAAPKVNYVKDDGSISVEQVGDKVRFDLSSAVGDHTCSLEGIATVKTASHAVYVSDDKSDKCTASLTFSGDKLKVETAECSASCGMRAEGSMDGEYTRSALGK